MNSGKPRIPESLSLEKTRKEDNIRLQELPSFEDDDITSSEENSTDPMARKPNY
jgi:hypothetical protein